MAVRSSSGADPCNVKVKEKTTMPTHWLLPLLSLSLTLVLRADGPADNQVDKVRPVPPPGVRVPDADRKALEEGVDELAKQIDVLRVSLKAKPSLVALLPDVQIYEKDGSAGSAFRS